MTRAEALALGYCYHCASYTKEGPGYPARQWCALGKPHDRCTMPPQLAESLRRAFHLAGEPFTDDLGLYANLKFPGAGKC